MAAASAGPETTPTDTAPPAAREQLSSAVLQPAPSAPPGAVATRAQHFLVVVFAVWCALMWRAGSALLWPPASAELLALPAPPLLAGI
jgi:hypothetical protein